MEMSRVACDTRDSAAPTASRIRAALLWRSGSQLAGQLAMWASTFLVLRILAPADYGLFAMTQVVIGLAQLMNGYGFAASLVQAERLEPSRISQIFGMLILTNLAIAAAQFAGAPIAAAWFDQPRLTALLRVQSLIHLTTPFIIMPQALLARSMDFRAQGRANIAAAAVGALAAPACALAGLGVWTLVVASLALFATRAALLARIGRWWVRPSFRFTQARAFVGFGGAIFVADALWFLQSQADILIAGRRFAAPALGLYAEGLFLTQIVCNKFVPALNDVAFPAYARMQGDRAQVGRGFARAAGTVMLVAAPCYAGLAATAEPLVLTAMGPHWAGAAPIVRLLALAMPFVTLHILFPSATNAMGRPGIAVRTAAAGAVLMSAAFLIGVRFGPLGMAAAWIAAMPPLLAFSATLSLPAIGLRAGALARAVLPPITAAAAMGMLVAAADRLLPPLAPAARLAALVPLGVVAYAALAMLLARPLVVDLLAMARRAG